MTIILFSASVLVHLAVAILIGFSVIFLVLDSLSGTFPSLFRLFDFWGEQFVLVREQLAIARRAPFAWAFIVFVCVLPASMGLWQAFLHSKGRSPSGKSVGLYAVIAVFAAYGALQVSVTALVQSSVRLTVMEGVNLSFASGLLAVWAGLYLVLAIFAGWIVGCLFSLGIGPVSTQDG